MSRVRTGHKPDDWHDIGGANARAVFGFNQGGYIPIEGGTYVTGTESEYERNRRLGRWLQARRRAQGKR